MEKMLAKENNITININELDSDELTALAEMLYRHGHMKETKECNDRRIWIEA